MTGDDPMAWLSCGAELRELDAKYESTRTRLAVARKQENADPAAVASILRELTVLRRQMLRLESAEVERISARHRQSERVPC